MASQPVRAGLPIFLLFCLMASFYFSNTARGEMNYIASVRLRERKNVSGIAPVQTPANGHPVQSPTSEAKTATVAVTVRIPQPQLDTINMSSSNLSASAGVGSQATWQAKYGVPGLVYLANHLTAYSCTSPVASKQSCLFHNVCFMIDGAAASQKLTAVRLQGSTATGMLGADAVLQQQLDALLQGLFNVHVFSVDDAMHEQLNTTSNTTQLVHSQLSLAYKLWLGVVDHDGGSGQPEAVMLTRTPTKGQRSTPTLFFEDKLTIISKTGGYQVRQVEQVKGPICIIVSRLYQPHCRALPGELPKLAQLLVQKLTTSCVAPTSDCNTHTFQLFVLCLAVAMQPDQVVLLWPRTRQHTAANFLDAFKSRAITSIAFTPSSALCAQQLGRECPASSCTGNNQP